MVTQQTAMGIAIAATCAVGLWFHNWLLVNTRHGQRLVRWFGDERGLHVLCALLVAGIVFGILLASDVVRPIHWKKI
jgi:hypothetical protein